MERTSQDTRVASAIRANMPMTVGYHLELLGTKSQDLTARLDALVGPQDWPPEVAVCLLTPSLFPLDIPARNWLQCVEWYGDSLLDKLISAECMITRVDQSEHELNSIRVGAERTTNQATWVQAVYGDLITHLGPLSHDMVADTSEVLLALASPSQAELLAKSLMQFSSGKPPECNYDAFSVLSSWASAIGATTCRVVDRIGGTESDPVFRSQVAIEGLYFVSTGEGRTKALATDAAARGLFAEGGETPAPIRARSRIRSSLAAVLGPMEIGMHVTETLGTLEHPYEVIARVFGLDYTGHGRSKTEAIEQCSWCILEHFGFTESQVEAGIFFHDPQVLLRAPRAEGLELDPALSEDDRTDWKTELEIWHGEKVGYAASPTSSLEHSRQWEVTATVKGVTKTARAMRVTTAEKEVAEQIVRALRETHGALIRKQAGKGPSVELVNSRGLLQQKAVRAYSRIPDYFVENLEPDKGELGPYRCRVKLLKWEVEAVMPTKKEATREAAVLMLKASGLGLGES